MFLELNMSLLSGSILGTDLTSCDASSLLRRWAIGGQSERKGSNRVRYKLRYVILLCESFTRSAVQCAVGELGKTFYVGLGLNPSVCGRRGGPCLKAHRLR